MPAARIVLLSVLAAVVYGILRLPRGRFRWVFLLEPLRSRVPEAHHAAFIADLWAHMAGYAGGIVGGLVLANRVWRSRQRAGR